MNNEDQLCNDPKCWLTKKGTVHKISDHKSVLEQNSNLMSIPIEKGEHFLKIHESSNTVFVSNNKSDSIQVIDGTKKIIKSKIQIERPRRLAVNTSGNTLYAICGDAGFWLRDTGAKISVIDLNSFEIVKTIGKKEGFGEIGFNPKTNMLFAVQPKSKNLWKIDGNSNEVLDKIKLDAHYYVLTVDSENDRVFLAGNKGGIRESVTVSEFDCKTNKLNEIAKHTTFSKNRPKQIFYNDKNNLIYCLLEGSPQHSEGDYDVYIRQVDVNSKKFSLKSDKRHLWDRMSYDRIKNIIYFSDTKKGEIQALNSSLEEIGLFQFLNPDLIKSDKVKGFSIRVNLCMNPESNQIFVGDLANEKLHILELPQI